MDQTVAMYYEHEKRFSLKIRGMQLFTMIHKFCKDHQWFKGNHYECDFDKQSKSLITFTINEEGDNSPSECIASTATDFHKLACISEIKIICLHFGAIVSDILQETYDTHTRYI